MFKVKCLRGHTLRLVALASVSVFALPAFAQVAQNPPATTVGPVKPMYGNLRAFYGDLTPYYGNIRGFYGNLRPFYGNIRPFYGNIRAFWGDANPFAADLVPFWGKLRAFDNGLSAPTVGDYWTKAGGDWDGVEASWTVAQTAGASGDYSQAAAQLRSLVVSAETFWGSAVQAKTGQSFQAGFAAPLLAKYGLDLNDPTSLSKLSQSDRSMFFLEWYDGLMNFTGTDHVDHWMKTVNWTPQLTQTQGYGADTVIGLLDFTVAGDTVIQKNIVKYGGVSNFTNGHGAAVASLMVGAHDGQGVMGIAPKASVIAYNPFDASGTAGWADISKGIVMLTQNRASVINMSLGVPGSTLDQGWNAVFSDPAVSAAAKNAVFVVAAGNDGVTQTANIDWNFATNPSLIVVGSIDLAGNISNFSNTPGTACLLDNSTCKPGDRLMDRFIVAPGELMLVSDDKGGVTRMSGTSFAAPLVSGAIALLQDRWPWLANYPKETTDIILKSAKDLGAPGVDPVYGVGLLDVTASQSPLDFNKLKWYQVDDKGKPKEQALKDVIKTVGGLPTTLTEASVSTVVSTSMSEQQLKFDAKGMYFYAFEPLGGTTRDFAIPLSSKLIGQNVITANGGQEQFQSYLLSRMNVWVAAQAAAGGRTKFAAANGFVEDAPVPNSWGMSMTVSIAPRPAHYGFRQDGPDYQSRLKIAGEKVVSQFGFGDGAVALANVRGLNSASDYDSDRGGANPLLGLASGGTFANFAYAMNDKLQISAGTTQRDVRRDRSDLPGLNFIDTGAERYQASAQHFGADYAVRPGVNVVGSYTRLHERSALLGTQSLDAKDFRQGTTTDGLTLGVGADLGHRTTLGISGTVARTRQIGGGQAIRIEDGLTSTAFEMALTKVGFIGKNDVARLTFSQPLFVNSGVLGTSTVQVIDRSTGAIGVVNNRIEVGQSRPLAGELLYGRQIFQRTSDLSLFGRVEVNPGAVVTQTFMAGGRIRIGF
ncbi:S8 family peptidase [Caulobacter sp. DWR2-3-1b2]|uniref:S8 family peptidase n=1 Tax=Caulobacter sp. DWR2-3-1b2 TaxID=2804642 RepID=UPI003CEB50D3